MVSETHVKQEASRSHVTTNDKLITICCLLIWGFDVFSGFDIEPQTTGNKSEVSKH